MVSQITLVANILGCIEKQGIKTLNARQINAVIKAATDIFFELRKPNTPSKPRQGLNAWLASDDTGSSSKYMAHILAGGPTAPYAHPHDPSDFGRCHRFLEAVTQRKPLLRMAGKSPQWRSLVAEWSALTALWTMDTDRSRRKIWERMKKILATKI